MGLYNPNVFLQIGDSDWFSPIHKATGTGGIPVIVPKARPNEAIRVVDNTGSVGWRAIFGANSRLPDTSKLYAEFRVTVAGADPAANAFGLTAVGGETPNTYYPGYITTGGTTASVGVNANSIHQNSVQIQTGLSLAIIVGNVIGLALYKEFGQYKVQFYNNGVPQGTPVVVTGAAFRLCAAFYYIGTEGRLCVDADDLRYMPTDCQPWGAAARISDSGGYSPAPGLLTAVGASATIEAATGRAFTSTVAQRSAMAMLSARGTAVDGNWRDMISFEAELEVMPTAGNIVGLGLAVSGRNLSSALGIVNEAGFWWSSGTSAFKRVNNGTSTGVTGGGSFVVGMRLGVRWIPSTGQVWFQKNGVDVEGNSANRSGASLTLPIGLTLCPIVMTGIGGRTRIYLNKKEFKYPVEHIQGWETTDILPDQYYRARLASDTEITQGIWFENPWGASNTGAPIGAIEIANLDGRYDRMQSANIRDQELAIYEYVGNKLDFVFKGLCETAECDGESIVRVLAKGKDAKLDNALPYDKIAFGQPEHCPVVPEGNTSQRFIYCNSVCIPANATVWDRGLYEADWTPYSTTGFYGFTRTDAPTGGKQTVSIFADNLTPLYQFEPIFALAGITVSTSMFSAPNVGRFDFFSNSISTVRQLLQELLNCSAAGYYTHKDGSLRGNSLVSGAPFDTQGNIIRSRKIVSVVNDFAPKLTTRVLYGKIYSPYQPQELAGSVTEADKKRLVDGGYILDHKNNPSFGGFHPFYSFAYSAAPVDANNWSNGLPLILSSAYDNKIRRFITTEESIEKVRNLNICDDLRLYHARYNLLDGPHVRLIRKTRRLLSPLVTCLFWG